MCGVNFYLKTVHQSNSKIIIDGGKLHSVIPALTKFDYNDLTRCLKGN